MLRATEHRNITLSNSFSLLNWNICRIHSGKLPLADNFLVLMIFAANSNPVFFCTHRRTTEKAPLKIRRREKMDYWKNSSFLLSSQVGSKLMSVDKSNMDRHDRERDHVNTLLFSKKVVLISNILKCRKTGFWGTVCWSCVKAYMLNVLFHWHYSGIMYQYLAALTLLYELEHERGTRKQQPPKFFVVQCWLLPYSDPFAIHPSLDVFLAFLTVARFRSNYMIS